jgi:hypothetical protein
LRLLVNFWYAHPVGHAIEALRYCLGYHLADPTLEVSVALTASTPVELAACCPFVRSAYAVGYTDFLGRLGDAGDPAGALAGVPHDWDYVLDDERSHDPTQLEAFPGLRRYYQAAHRHFRARVHHGAAGAEPPQYRPHGRLRLRLPTRRERPGPVAIAVMPAGSSEPSRYPSVASWQLILHALREAFPEGTFCFVGKLERDARTSTSWSRDDFEALGRGIWAVDEPLLDQLALVDACDVFVSPHTGFGTAAISVGTPWLTLSGGPWHEWFFNGVPFYSVLPDTTRYPAFTQMDEPPELVDDDGQPRTPSMTRARIEEDLPELVKGARLLIERRLSYEEALRRYFPRLLETYGGDRERIFSFDAVHAAYV